MSASENSLPIKRALQELKYALIATLITLAAASVLYMWTPALRHYLQTKRERVGYIRKVSIKGSEGSILYKSTGTESLENLRQDAELLKRRFERGEFRILTIAESTLRDAVQEMKKNQTNFRYTIQERDGGIALEIRATSPAATKALQKYMGILEHAHDTSDDF